MTRQTKRRRRRHSSVCHRHPTSKPTAGLCATCLRERLSTIESLSSDQIPELRRVHDASAAEEEEEEGRASRRLMEEESEDGVGEVKKTMKEFIDLESATHQTKKNDVASVLTRTLKKLSLNLPKNVNYQETAVRRRSCDVDPRQGRISLEEPRASWDGCLTGKTYPKPVPLSAVTEEDDAKASPGGTAQTRDYYFDSRRRRSFDGLLEVDELKGRLSPSPEAVGLFHGAKLLVTERELRDSDWYAIKPEGLELASNKGVGSVAAGEVKKTVKKWPKGWNLWGLIQRKADAVKKETKTDDAMEGPFVESLLKLRRVATGESNVREKLMRSYSVSARKSCDGLFHGGGFQGGRSSCDGLFHGSVTGVETGRRRRRRRRRRRSSCDGLFHGSVTGVETGRRRRKSSCEEGFFIGIEGKGDHILQRDAKLESYSPDNLRNGMVRFYFTPLKNHTTSNSGKSRLIH